MNDAPFTCTVNYGDGSGDLAGVISGNTCTGPAHTYTTFGSYTVTVSVTDKDGGTGSNTATHIVIFNWAGFFQPVDNLPTLNSVNAGQCDPGEVQPRRQQGPEHLRSRAIPNRHQSPANSAQCWMTSKKP